MTIMCLSWYLGYIRQQVNLLSSDLMGPHPTMDSCWNLQGLTFRGLCIEGSGLFWQSSRDQPKVMRGDMMLSLNGVYSFL